jgi:Kef-type K+ transport system membrane component KefB
MKLLAEIGIILLLFEVGMDTDVFRLAKAGSKPIVVAIAGVVFPFGFGYLVSHQIFDLPLLASLFIAGTLTATSIGITVRVLTDLQRRNSDEAQIVVGAAVLDDIVGVILLAFLYQFAVSGEMSLIATAKVGAYIVLFMLISPIAAKFIGYIIAQFDRSDQTAPGLLLTMTLSLIMLFSYLAHAIGAPEIMGGFAAGIAMSQHFRISLSSRFKVPFIDRINRIFAPNPALSHQLETQMRPLIHTFTPLFFIMVGISLNLKQVDWSSGFVWGLSALLLLVAVAGKLVAGYLIKEPRLQQAIIGLSMIPRGEVGLIFAQLGYANGILDAQIYAALLIVIALTTVVPPFIIKWLYQHEAKTSNFAQEKT